MDDIDTIMEQITSNPAAARTVLRLALMADGAQQGDEAFAEAQRLVALLDQMSDREVRALAQGDDPDEGDDSDQPARRYAREDHHMSGPVKVATHAAAVQATAIAVAALAGIVESYPAGSEARLLAIQALDQIEGVIQDDHLVFEDHEAADRYLRRGKPVQYDRLDIEAQAILDFIRP